MKPQEAPAKGGGPAAPSRCPQQHSSCLHRPLCWVLLPATLPAAAQCLSFACKGKQAGTPRRSQAAVYQPGAWKHLCQKCSRNRSQLHSTGLRCTGRGTEVFFPALAVSQPGCVFLTLNQILRAVHTQHMVTIPVIFLRFDLALRMSTKLLCWCPA